MSAPAFTPGPWQFRWVADLDIATSIDADKAPVADVYRCDAAEANSHLIAAAPALYGQLESGQTDLDLLRRAIEENDPKAELLIRVTDLWKRNESALAQARGESA